MDITNPSWLLEKLALLAPLLFSLTIHEFAHARTALAFGDPTAKNNGRCTLNPLAHLDPIGTLAIIFCGFGWAKPVPVNPYNLRPRRAGYVAVSLAGPLSNLMLAILTALLLRALLAAGVKFSSQEGRMALEMVLFLMAVNFCLFIFNMLPLYPLDGHHIVREQLTPAMQAAFMHWQLRYGRMVLVAIIMLPFLANFLRLQIVSPIGWVLGHTIDLAFRYLILPG